MNRQRVWYCKIVGTVDEIPPGSDLPMRQAVKKAFKEVTGKECEVLFSGWHGELNEYEQNVFDEMREKPNG